MIGQLRQNYEASVWASEMLFCLIPPVSSDSQHFVSTILSASLYLHFISDSLNLYLAPTTSIYLVNRINFLVSCL